VRACWSIAICPGGCIPNAECVSPSLCRCLDGFTGPKCRWTATANKPPTEQRRTRPSQTGPSKNDVTTPDDVSSTQRCRCLNGGRCVRSRCKCLPGFAGPRCRYGQYTFSLQHHRLSSPAVSRQNIFCPVHTFHLCTSDSFRLYALY